jgi:RNA polymerase sigma factor (sigma-70 family)
MSTSGLVQAFMTNRAALQAYLQLRGASPHEAEDVLQEVFVRLTAEPVGPVAQPRAYLYRMAENRMLHQRRAQGRRVAREEHWVEANLGDPPFVVAEPSAEQWMIAREQLALFRGVIDELPERTGYIFRRFRLDGETQPRIASELDISVSAVEKHLARAYRALIAARSRLDEESGGGRHHQLKGDA